jgi:hypothetical protein
MRRQLLHEPTSGRLPDPAVSGLQVYKVEALFIHWPFPLCSGGLPGCSLALGQNDIERKKYVQDMTSLLEH